MGKKRAKSRPAGSVDPVTAEVIRGALETVAFEMATHVSLAATTPILNQSNERNATILDAAGRLAALDVGIPQLMLSSATPVKFAIEFFGDDFAEGDVIVANDPYHGGGHLPDFSVFSPVFSDGELVLFASIQAHHADVGGSTPGGYSVDAMDVWAEGIRIPCVKVVEGGRERRDVVYLLRTNNRTPTFIGDLKAQIGAAQLGARRCAEVLRRFGNETVKAAVDSMIDLAERRFREEVSTWPDGVYEGDAFIEHDVKGTEDVHVHCTVTIKGEQLTVDFTGSDDRPWLQNWSTLCNTRGMVVAQVATMMDPSVPRNEGLFRAIEFIVPEGTVLNPVVGKPVSAGTHHPGVEVSEAVCMALAKAVPEKCCPQGYKAGLPTVVIGVNPRNGQFYIDHSVDTTGTNCAAAYGRDGWGANSATLGNLIMSTAEINESIFPSRQWARDYITDGGGPGRWRGNPGTLVVKETTADAMIYTWVMGMRYPSPGVGGGKPGSPNQLVLRAGGDNEYQVTHTAFLVPHSAGERIMYRYGGGGGWGDPLERDPEAVRQDVLDDLVSVEAARRDYGVVLAGDPDDERDLRVDAGATERLRGEMQRVP